MEREGSTGRRRDQLPERPLPTTCVRGRLGGCSRDERGAKDFVVGERSGRGRENGEAGENKNQKKVTRETWCMHWFLKEVAVQRF